MTEPDSDGLGRCLDCKEGCVADTPEPKEDLHETAGLTYSGKNFEGDSEWIGTQQAWERYDQLSKTQEKYE